jgi:hypothetical protein
MKTALDVAAMNSIMAAWSAKKWASAEYFVERLEPSKRVMDMEHHFEEPQEVRIVVVNQLPASSVPQVGLINGGTVA